MRQINSNKWCVNQKPHKIQKSSIDRKEVTAKIQSACSNSGWSKTVERKLGSSPEWVSEWPVSFRTLSSAAIKRECYGCHVKELESAPHSTEDDIPRIRRDLSPKGISVLFSLLLSSTTTHSITEFGWLQVGYNSNVVLRLFKAIISMN